MKTSPMFSLNLNDLIKGLVVAVFAGVITYLDGVVNAPGFDFSVLNWHSVLTIAIIAGVSYLVKNFVSNTNGQVAGIIG